MEKKLNIIHIITSINRGGAENHLVDLIRGQVAQKHGVCVAYLKGDGYWTQTLINLGVQILPLRMRFYGNLIPIFKLLKLIINTKPNVLHAHMPPAELYARLALLFIPFSPVFVISKHNDEPFFRGLGWRVIGRFVARKAYHIIAISDAVNKYVCKNFCLEKKRVSTVYYGIDHNQFTNVSKKKVVELRKKWGISSHDLVIGTVGRLVPQKAQHILLKGYAQYRLISKKPSKLIIVGKGPLKNKLTALARNLKLEKEIIWTGFLENIPEIMNAFDVFVLTSSYEGLGLVLLEAMAAKRPVVASAVSAIPEVVINGYTGIIVQPSNIKLLAQAFQSLEDKNLRYKLGDSGHRQIIKFFSLDMMVQKTTNIYNKYIR